MSGERPGERRYSEAEVALIIRRASELQEESLMAADPGTGMTLPQLEQIAREAGLDPALVRHAAAGVGRPDTDAPTSRFIGAPTTVRLERVVDGVLVEDDYEAVVRVLEDTIGETGVASTLGHTLQWTASRVMPRGAGMQGVRVTLAPREGRTTIRVEEPFESRAEGIFGVLMVAGTFLGASIAAPAFLGTGGAPAAAGAFAGVVGLSYGLARLLYGGVVRRRQVRLATVADRMALAVGEASASRAGPT